MSYGRDEEYGGGNRYGTQGGYGASDSYETSNPYGASNPYGSSAGGYGASNPYGSSNPYGQTEEYGSSNPYGQSNPYGSSARNVAAEVVVSEPEFMSFRGDSDDLAPISLPPLLLNHQSQLRRHRITRDLLVTRPAQFLKAKLTQLPLRSRQHFKSHRR